MSAQHDHGSHEPFPVAKSAARRLIIALGITLTFLVVEMIGAAVTNSLALLADAGHMLTDVAALSVALMAAWLATKPHSAVHSYGNMRAEILAALANGVGLLVISGYIFIEAAGRLRNPPEVSAAPMMAVAALGLLVNLVSAFILTRGAAHSHSLNMRGAVFHVFSDALGSLGALAGGAVMLAFGWYLADPLIGMGMSVLLVITSAKLIWPAVHILLEGTPKDIYLPELERCIMEQNGVAQVHDLHAWTLTSGYNAVTAHVVVSENVALADREQVLDGLRHMIPRRFPVSHVTIQIEVSAEECEEAHMPGPAAETRQSRFARGPHGGNP